MKAAISRYLVLMLGLSIFALSFQPVGNTAPLTIEITESGADAIPVAIVPFSTSGKKAPPDSLSDIISSNLFRTGQFTVLPVADMLSKPSTPDQVKYQNWRVLDVENIVIGQVKHLGGDRFHIYFWLYDIFKGKELFAYELPIKAANYRAAAHKISDIVYEKLIGEPGAFSTQIAYVTAAMDAGKPIYKLWMADADSKNEQVLLRSREPITTPKWSPNGKLIVYASFEEGGNQKIFIQDWANGTREKINKNKKGIEGAPAWSRDGKYLAYTHIRDGNSEIYVYNVKTKKNKQVTRHWAIDTEPEWSVDGKEIIFTSDRGGRPQIYKIPVEGGRVKRLTFEGRENARAALSPDGKLIAMVHRANDDYQIAVQELATGNLRVLTDGWADESPSFAPNGSMILYATTKADKGVLAVVSVDRTGGFFFKPYDGEVREPAWSPLNNN